MLSERGTTLNMFRKFVLVSPLTSEDDACFQCVIKSYVITWLWRSVLSADEENNFFLLMRDHTLARVSYA
jgi:hypothetical protein